MGEPICVWSGPEKELAYCCCVTNFTLDKLTPGKYAEGTITAKDYIEGGIAFSDSWEATADESGIWKVKRKDDGKGFWRDSETGEIHFTANSAINDAMKSFVSERVNDFINTGIAKIGPAEYQGPKVEYAGPCVCDKLKQSSNRNPFSWKEITGGNFPERCFACSCGEKWWCSEPSEHRWEKVDDEKAWEMLLTYNGVEVQPLVFLEDQKGFKLLQTIRNMGFIPLG